MNSLLDPRNQLELTWPPSPDTPTAPPPAPPRSPRQARARWWFSRMREAVRFASPIGSHTTGWPGLQPPRLPLAEAARCQGVSAMDDRRLLP